MGYVSEYIPYIVKMKEPIALYVLSFNISFIVIEITRKKNPKYPKISINNFTSYSYNQILYYLFYFKSQNKSKDWDSEFINFCKNDNCLPIPSPIIGISK